MSAIPCFGAIGELKDFYRSGTVKRQKVLKKFANGLLVPSFWNRMWKRSLLLAWDELIFTGEGWMLTVSDFGSFCM